MTLLKLLEKIQTETYVTPLDRELLEAIELHLRCLTDVMGLYVECTRQPDTQIRRILNNLEEKLYGTIQAPEGRADRGVNEQAY
jgi:hypothetical protein